MNIPNLITVGRLLAVPVTVWLILDRHFAAAFWLFVATGISDAIDGWVAKRYHLESDLGRHLDPLADKALLVAVYLTLGAAGHLPSWLVIMVVFRDLAILGGALLGLALKLQIQIRPLLISKVNTGAQIVLAAVVLGRDASGFLAQAAGPATTLLITAVAATTLLSGISYLYRFGVAARATKTGIAE